MAPKRYGDNNPDPEIRATKKLKSLSGASTTATKHPGPRSSFRPIARKTSAMGTSESTMAISRTLTIEDRSSRKGSNKMRNRNNILGKLAADGVDLEQQVTFGNGNSHEHAHIYDVHDLNEALPSIEAALPVKEHTKKRDYTNKRALEDWLDEGFRSVYLDELLRHDGLGDSYCCLKSDSPRLTCTKCDSHSTDIFKCKDCINGNLVQCASCLVDTHSNLPFHAIERWNGKYFEQAALVDLGLKIQLGHGGLKVCSRPVTGPKNFLVIDTTGIHHVSIDWCGCSTGTSPGAVLDPISKHKQLLRSRWFPASLHRPRSAFTFDALDTLYELTLQSKINLYDFFNTLLSKTDKLQLKRIPTRHNDLHRAFRIWCCLIPLKRSGRGHDPGGVDATSKGETAVICPACPHPGKNLPDGWNLNPEKLFLYTLFIAVDANFKLKGKDRGLTDIDLTPGWGYCVEDSAYQKHLEGYREEAKMNTCHSEHDAIVRAAVRATPGYNVTGAGVVMCSRHGLIQPNGVADLQKGERYCNMDYVVLSALLFAAALTRVVITYDIACQWSKNLKKRMDENLPESLRIPPTMKIETAIPSWHINGHGPDCQTKFALAYKTGMGRTCGDEIEGSFSHTNSLGASLREMAEAARHEALDHTYSGYNFNKVIRLRGLLRRKLMDAVGMTKKHAENFERFSETFDKKQLQTWQTQIQEWESDHSKPCPYDEVKCETTLHDIRLQLAKEDAEEAVSGTSTTPAHTMPMSSFLVMGLELEDQQRVLATERAAAKDNLTSKQEADLTEKGTALRRRIQNWRNIQLIYQPHLASQTNLDSDVVEHDLVEKLELRLPSSMMNDNNTRNSRTTTRLAQMELRLRKGQLDDSLEEICRLRRVIVGMWYFKKSNLAGQGNKPNTRIRSTLTRFNSKVDRAADRYRAAHASLDVLDPEGDWKVVFRPLLPADISGPGQEQDTDMPDKKKAGDKAASDKSKGRFTLSWIWLVSNSKKSTAGEVDAQNETLRVEWAKAQARYLRWKEELDLVLEEMRRVIAYLEWKARWWRDQVRRRCSSNTNHVILHGISGYAYKQEALFVAQAETCRIFWAKPLTKSCLTIPWPSPELALPAVTNIDDINQRVSTRSIEEDGDSESNSGSSQDESIDGGDDPLDTYELGE